MGRRPPARLTVSLLGSSHLGQLFTSTAPSLDPFLVKIKNPGVKNPKVTAPPSHLQWTAQKWTKCGLHPTEATPTWTHSLSLTRVVRFQKNREATAQRNNLIKTEGGKRKKKKGGKKSRGGGETEDTNFPVATRLRRNLETLTLTLTEGG